jgi:hypothetical protein
MTKSRLPQMDVDVDQAGRHDKFACVDFFNFGFRIPDFGFGGDNLSVFDANIRDLIPFIRRIDYAAVANDRRAHVVAIPPQR